MAVANKSTFETRPRYGRWHTCVIPVSYLNLPQIPVPHWDGIPVIPISLQKVEIGRRGVKGSNRGVRGVFEKCLRVGMPGMTGMTPRLRLSHRQTVATLQSWDPEDVGFEH